MRTAGVLSWTAQLPLRSSEILEIESSQRKLSTLCYKIARNGLDRLPVGVVCDYLFRTSVYEALDVAGALWGLYIPNTVVMQYRYQRRFDPQWSLSSTFYYTWLVETLQERGIDLQRFALILRTTHLDEDGNLRYWERWQDIGEPKRLKLKSMAKYLRMMQKTFKIENLTEDNIQQFSENFGQIVVLPPYELKLVNGDSIVEIYREEYFGSCMHSSNSVEFYAEQPSVEMLVIRDPQTRTLKGRALVWELTSGDKFLDRVYPSDGGAQIEAAITYAKKQGWGYKIEQCIDGRYQKPPRKPQMEVRVKDVGYYPYMDTFGTSEAPDKGWMHLHPDAYSFCWHSTDNECPWGDESECEYCDDMGAYYPVDDFMYVPSVQRYVSLEGISEFYISDYRGRYIHVDHASVIDNEPDQFWASNNSNGDLRQNIVDSGCRNYYFSLRDPDDLICRATAGPAEGEYFFREDTVEIDGEIYWELEAPEIEEDEVTE